MEKYSRLKTNDDNKDIVLTAENKKDLNEVINNQINTLLELQKNLNENDQNIISFNEVKEIVFKSEYFLFKLKSILQRYKINGKIKITCRKITVSYFFLSTIFNNKDL